MEYLFRSIDFPSAWHQIYCGVDGEQSRVMASFWPINRPTDRLAERQHFFIVFADNSFRQRTAKHCMTTSFFLYSIVNYHLIEFYLSNRLKWKLAQYSSSRVSRQSSVHQFDMFKCTCDGKKKCEQMKIAYTVKDITANKNEKKKAGKNCSSNITDDWGGKKRIAISYHNHYVYTAGHNANDNDNDEVIVDDDDDGDNNNNTNIFSLGRFFAFVLPPPLRNVCMRWIYIARAFFQAYSFFISLSPLACIGDCTPCVRISGVLYFSLSLLFACYLRLSTEWPSMHIFHFLDEIFHVFFRRCRLFSRFAHTVCALNFFPFGVISFAFSRSLFSLRPLFWICERALCNI